MSNVWDTSDEEILEGGTSPSPQPVKPAPMAKPVAKATAPRALLVVAPVTNDTWNEENDVVVHTPVEAIETLPPQAPPVQSTPKAVPKAPPRAKPMPTPKPAKVQEPVEPVMDHVDRADQARQPAKAGNDTQGPKTGGFGVGSIVLAVALTMSLAGGAGYYFWKSQPVPTPVVVVPVKPVTPEPPKEEIVEPAAQAPAPAVAPEVTPPGSPVPNTPPVNPTVNPELVVPPPPVATQLPPMPEPYKFPKETNTGSAATKPAPPKNLGFTATAKPSSNGVAGKGTPPVAGQPPIQNPTPAQPDGWDEAQKRMEEFLRRQSQ